MEKELTIEECNGKHTYRYCGRDDMFAILVCTKCDKELLVDIADYYEAEERDEEDEDIDDDD